MEPTDQVQNSQIPSAETQGATNQVLQGGAVSGRSSFGKVSELLKAQQITDTLQPSISTAKSSQGGTVSGTSSFGLLASKWKTAAPVETAQPDASATTSQAPTGGGQGDLSPESAEGDGSQAIDPKLTEPDETGQDSDGDEAMGGTEKKARKRIWVPSLNKLADPLDWAKLCYHCGEERAKKGHPGSFMKCKAKCVQCGEHHTPTECPFGRAYIDEASSVLSEASKKRRDEARDARIAKRAAKVVRDAELDGNQQDKTKPNASKKSASGSQGPDKKGKPSKAGQNGPAKAKGKTSHGGSSGPKGGDSSSALASAAEAAREDRKELMQLRKENHLLNKKLQKGNSSFGSQGNAGLMSGFGGMGMMPMMAAMGNAMGFNPMMGMNQMSLPNFGMMDSGLQAMQSQLMANMMAKMGVDGSGNGNGAKKHKSRRADDSDVEMADDDKPTAKKQRTSKGNSTNDREKAEFTHMPKSEVAAAYTRAPDWVTAKGSDGSEVYAYPSPNDPTRATYLPAGWVPLIHQTSADWLMYHEDSELATSKISAVWERYKSYHGYYPREPQGWQGSTRAADHNE